MSAEIICVGTELLLGDILNTNVQFLARELANLGIPHFYQTVVGDNMTRLHEVIKIASQRASILVFTGGLGPTPDDLTTETIAQVFKTPLVEHPEIIRDISQKFAARRRSMAFNNRKQALLPKGADIIPNPSGTAPGLLWQPRPNLTLMTFPGVPSEMKRMWSETAVSFLKNQGWGKETIYSRMLYFKGIGESDLSAKLAHFFELSNPTVAPYASLGEVRLRLSAKARSKMEAIALIEPITQEIKEIAGLDYYGSDEDTLALVVGNLLRQARETVSVAESCTGGGLGAVLTTVSGSSDYFLGGITAYKNKIKIDLLGVNPTDLEQNGAVSGQIAQQMALGAKKRLGTSWGISITGIAGPGGGNEIKPVGLVYIGLADDQGGVESFECHFGTMHDRDTIRLLSSYTALDQLRRKLLLRK
ncbi:competence/damage-inducible protein A [Cyanobacterium sp. uoEpiScrs1]|uniref:competence/damage-inducible protein A n=1 Tax=Cyanobacterium sp. uoEpiScrs1 TaxID=2976343 RepID=UPI00226A0CA2|nr:competence/damage-inducible protein A [Cyanobacterium sp. uoEpiScrs1]